MRTVLRTALVASAFTALALAAQAKPEYAMKEKKLCGYCHVKPEGGGARNPRGVFYAMHAKSFEGYDEVKVMGAQAKKTGTPQYKSSWKITLAEGVSRVAVGDVTGDKSLKIVSYADGRVMVCKVGEKDAVCETIIETGKEGAKLAVGNFAKGKPAVIAVPHAVYIYADGKFAKRAADVEDITGTVTFSNGADNFFFFAGGMPDVYAVDIAADKPVIGGQDMVAPDQGAGVYANITVHAPPEMLGQLGLPDAGVKAGVFAFFDPRAEKKLFAMAPWLEKDVWNIRVFDAAGFGPGAAGGEPKVLWQSPALGGKVLDICFANDAKNPKVAGMYILMATGKDGKGRTLEFMQLD